ncbi:MAG TPA: M15 family metallopeptidase [Actinomycetota bacterium]
MSAAVRGRRIAAVTLGLVVGLAVGGVAGFVAQGQGRPAGVPSPATSRSPSPSPVASNVQPVHATRLLAWTPGELPAGYASKVARLRGVDRMTEVVGGTAWMTRSLSVGGAVVDRPPAGMAIPLDVAAARLASFAPFLPPADRAFLPDLARGSAVLGASSAKLRRLGPGGVLWFGHTRIRVAGVVPDTEIGAAEVFVSLATARRIGVTRPRYLLIDPTAGASRVRLTARLRGLLPKGVPLQVRASGETPYLRQGDAVLPPVVIKELFGEFAARPHAAGGWLTVDRAWSTRHLVTTTVPILGEITCNRAIMQQLRGALNEIVREGLAHLIDPKDYAGCYAPRLLRPTDPTGGISHHAWGIALDINASQNPFGATPHQDPRIVRIFERYGFTWGGRWVVPDGMHFEYVRPGMGA